MTDDGFVMRHVWPLLASLAGAITALTFRPWEGMKWTQIGMALFVGMSFSFYVSPLALTLLYGSGPIDPRQAGVVYYLMASGSNVLIARAIKWMTRIFGENEKEDV